MTDVQAIIPHQNILEGRHSLFEADLLTKLVVFRCDIGLDMQGACQKFAVKRNNQYVCLANDTFKFLNISTFLSPGVSYTQFLKAFDVTPEHLGRTTFPFRSRPFDKTGSLPL
jgi:hypothetical protein